MSPLTCGSGSCSGLELQQQLVSNPAEVLQRPQESVESPRATVRQDVQQLESFLSAGGQRLDVLHLRRAQNVLLVQKRNDGVADQELTGQLQPVLPQQSSVFRLHASKRWLTALFSHRAWICTTKLAAPPLLVFVRKCVRRETRQRNHVVPRFTLSRFSLTL